MNVTVGIAMVAARRMIGRNINTCLYSCGCYQLLSTTTVNTSDNGDFILRKQQQPLPGKLQSPEKTKYLLPKRIILLRHGESLGNIDDTAYASIPDWKIPLTRR